MKRLVAFSAFLVLAAAAQYVGSSNAFAVGADYTASKQAFDAVRTSGLRQLYPTSNFSRNIAAMALQNPKLPFRDDLARQELREERELCSKEDLYITANCGNLIRWAQMMRMFYLSERQPTGSAFKMSPELRAEMLAFFYYVLNRSVSGLELEDNHGPATTLAGTWKNESENHLATTESFYYLAATALAEEPLYAQQPLKNNNRTVAEMRNQWQRHWAMWADERVKHGLFIEFNANTYNKYTFAALFNLLDFAPSQAIREKIRGLFDLYFAVAAQESLANGVRGGAQTRKSPTNTPWRTTFPVFFRFYVANQLADTSGSFNLVGPGILTSSYFPPEAVWRLWGNPTRSAYEVSVRVPGVVNDVRDPYIDPTRNAFRTTYVTPEFVLGSNLIDVNNHTYAHLSSESRGPALYLNEGSLDGKNIPFIQFEPKEGQCFDQVNAVQKKNAMVVQNHVWAFLFSPADIRNCYSFGKHGQGAGLDNVRYVVQSSRTDSLGNVFNLKFPFADQAFNGKDNNTRMMTDLEFSSSFRREQTPHGLFLESPERSTFIWVKPVNSDFEVLNGYSEGTGLREDSFYLKNMVLTTDKFSPMAVVVSPAVNFGGDFAAFRREVARMSRLTYASNKVTFQQPLRSSLEAGDFFLDSSRGTIVGDLGWTENRNPDAHDLHSFVANEYGSGLSFTVEIPRNGTYYLKSRAANADGIWVYLNGKLLTSHKFPARSATLAWNDVPGLEGASGVFLPQGRHNIKVMFRRVGAEFDSLALVSGRNENPAVIEFQENLNGKQPLSRIGGRPVNDLAPYGSYTAFSPYMRSERGSGIWEIRAGGSTLRLNHRGPVPVREENVPLGWE